MTEIPHSCTAAALLTSCTCCLFRLTFRVFDLFFFVVNLVHFLLLNALAQVKTARGTDAIADNCSEETVRIRCVRRVGWGGRGLKFSWYDPINTTPETHHLPLSCRTSGELAWGEEVC